MKTTIIRLVLLVLWFGSAGAAVAQPMTPPSTKELASSPIVASTTKAPDKRITEYTLSPELHRKAHRLSRIHFGEHVTGAVYGIFLLWLILRRRWSIKFREWAEAASRRRIVQAIIFTPLLVLTLVVLQLPLDVLSEAVEKSYGISVQSWASWIGDWAKLQGIVIVIGALMVWILYAVIRYSPRRWWLVFWFVALPIFTFIFFVEPFVIDPMFNHYEPLTVKAPQLVPELQRVTRRAGMEVPPERMFWMEASNKTIVTNAYVTGFGASKRVVIWDTSLAQETTDGILFMFGHEMGHYVLGHIWKAMIFTSVMAFLLLYLSYRTIGRLLALRGAAWGIRSLDDWASLPALLLLASVFGFVATVAGNTFSRYQENQADIYGLEITHGIIAEPGQAGAISFQKYGETAFVDPDPNPVSVLLFFDHPTVADRVRLFATYDPWGEGRNPQFVK